MDWYALKIMQQVVHYSLHLLFPALLSYLFFRKTWKRAWLIMVATMAVDLDHLLANPIFDPNRCSVGFHLLHSTPAIIFYALLLLIPNTIVRVIAIGLLFHMLTDYIDCRWNEWLIN